MIRNDEKKSITTYLRRKKKRTLKREINHLHLVIGLNTYNPSHPDSITPQRGIRCLA